MEGPCLILSRGSSTDSWLCHSAISQISGYNRGIIVFTNIHAFGGRNPNQISSGPQGNFVLLELVPGPGCSREVSALPPLLLALCPLCVNVSLSASALSSKDDLCDTKPPAGSREKRLSPMSICNISGRLFLGRVVARSEQRP